MKKILKSISIISIIIVGLLIITACSSKENKNEIDSNVIGTWEYTEDSITATYIFKEDGTGTYTMTVEENTVEKEVEYYTKDGKLFINYDKEPETFELKYQKSGNDLIIYDSFDEELLYKKK